MQYCVAALQVVTSTSLSKSWYAHGTVVAAAPLLDDELDVVVPLEELEEVGWPVMVLLAGTHGAPGLICALLLHA